MSKNKKNKSVEPKPVINKEVLEEIKDNFWDIKDPYPTAKTFTASLIQFCLYAVLASAGGFARLMEYNVDPVKFWVLVAIGAMLCTIPVFMYRYKFVLIVSLVLSIAIGVTSANYSQSSKGVDINTFYYVDMFAIAMALLIGFVLLRRLANLSVKKPEKKVSR